MLSGLGGHQAEAGGPGVQRVAPKRPFVGPFETHTILVLGTKAIILATYGKARVSKTVDTILNPETQLHTLVASLEFSIGEPII